MMQLSCDAATFAVGKQTVGRCWEVLKDRPSFQINTLLLAGISYDLDVVQATTPLGHGFAGVAAFGQRVITPTNTFVLYKTPRTT
jgi:hypothetical protein